MVQEKLGIDESFFTLKSNKRNMIMLNLIQCRAIKETRWFYGICILQLFKGKPKQITKLTYLQSFYENHFK